MKLQEKIERISLKRCKEIQEINTYKGQRNRGDAHVKDLATKMDDGRFHTGLIALMERNGETFVINGQHQVEAALRVKKPFRALVQYWEANGATDVEVARVFSQYDVHKPRSRGDIGWIHAQQIGWDDWPRKCVSLLVTGLAALHTGDFVFKTTLSKDESAELLNQNRESCEWFYKTFFVTVGDRSRDLWRGAVCAAAIATRKKSHEDADMFWRKVRDGEMLKRSEPAYRLRAYLATVAVSGGGHVRNGKTPASPHEIYCRCLTAWNAFRKGETTNLKYYQNAAIPKIR